MATLTDLPPELLDHITSYLPTASSVSNLSRSSKSLQHVVEKDGWATFNRSRFPSIQTPHPPSTPPSPSYQRDVARTLVTLSRNGDRRAFAARYIEPAGHIRTFPSGQKVEKWKRPRGQTIGFVPQLDSYEHVGQRWSDRKEVLALSAGAEICVREKKSRRRSGGGRHEDVRWVTYRPDGAVEGRDDVTTLHLLRPQSDGEDQKELQVVRGTANGALELHTLPLDLDAESHSGVEYAARTTFQTDELPVRSTSLLQRPSHHSLLAAALGETRVCLYALDDSSDSQQVSVSQFDVPRPQNGARTYRTWSTNFISPTNLAVGLGPSEEPIHIYALTPSGIDKDTVRKISLQNDIDRLEGEITLSNFARKSTSSVYPIVPLPPTATESGDGSLFLSGAYDGVIRLHDLRSERQLEGAYVDPTDDSAVYSLLSRGREKLVVGTSRHSVMKVFDLRMGARCYSYLSATSESDSIKGEEDGRGDWNLFLKPHSATYPGRGGGNNWARRSAESSIYSLTSPSPMSPFVYAGVENAVVELAFTNLLDDASDPAFFDPNTVAFGTKAVRDHGAKHERHHGGPGVGDVLNLAMYEQNAVRMELMSQRGVGETRRLMRGVKQDDWRGSPFVQGLDARWRVGT